MLAQDLLQALIEISLQVLIVFHFVRTNESLNFRIVIPWFAIYFVSADVKVSIWKEFRHFSDELVQKLVGTLLRGVHYRVHAAWLDFVGTRSTGQLGISHEPRA